MRSLREHDWPRWLRAPDGQLVARLYEPALRRAIIYDRCCAYFSSSALSAAAAGFGAFIERILNGEIVNKPAIRLLVNEELSEADARTLLEAGESAPLITHLLDQLGTAESVLQQDRLKMLAWLVREGWLSVKVGVMRRGGGILHAKFGLFTDASGDAVTFSGSGNESARGLASNYEKLEISACWNDQDRHEHFRQEFDLLWSGSDPAVATLPLPEAVERELIKLAPGDAPTADRRDDLGRKRAAMLWQYALSASFFPKGAATCDAMAPIDLWPHQRKVVGEVAAAWPEGRLLCDEVGMGKTIEAIVTLRRLLAGRGVRRALFLLPANLLAQWQGELREKGGLRVPRLEGPRSLIWPDGTRQPISGLTEALEQDLLLMSRETARMEGNVGTLLEAKPWDLVLLDEGHAARRANQIEGEFNSPTLLLGLLRELQSTDQAKSLMILSATPMQTHPWEPWDLLQVLGEGGAWLSGFHVVRSFYEALAAFERGVFTGRDTEILAELLAAPPGCPAPPRELALPNSNNPEAFARSLRFLPETARQRAAHWMRTCTPLARRMHRNTRRTLQRYFELGLLERPPATRDVREELFDFDTTEEREVYEQVARYIDRRFDELEEQKPGKGFVMTIYRRRAASSPVALRLSLERRVRGLRAVIAQRAIEDLLDGEDAEELEELLNVKLTSAFPESPEEAARELVEVENLLAQIDALGALDTKRDRLASWVRNLTSDGRSVLVFTSYADTMEYLRSALVSAFGSAVASYSGEGGMRRVDGSWKFASKEEVTSALREGEIKILVCTDAASEGLNLQAAGALINYDLPWNPSKVEQRIGRIDRIGQRLSTLPIVNLYLRNSIDERVYRALANRCGLFETYVGPMQPVLSRALRMLIGRADFDEDELARLAEEIRKTPFVVHAFPEDDASQFISEPPLVTDDAVSILIARLTDAGIEVKREGNSGYFIPSASLRIVVKGALATAPVDAGCLDGLNPDQWSMLRDLQEPGERLPLILGWAERGAFRVGVCRWMNGSGWQEVTSFAELVRVVDAWDGSEPDLSVWLHAQRSAEADARSAVDALNTRAGRSRARARQAQVEAARLRLIEELGRTLVCFSPETEDLNQKFRRLAMERTPSGDRFRRVFSRLGSYPDWTSRQLETLAEFRADLTQTQVKTRLTGREIDAALADPRWRAVGNEQETGSKQQ